MHKNIRIFCGLSLDQKKNNVNKGTILRKGITYM
uniref:Uncharacterized protein n=1 Tax=Rhizophora mucronata TaxID=61149 RepID=A0A2P2PFX7_RHIMU